MSSLSLLFLLLSGTTLWLSLGCLIYPYLLHLIEEELVIEDPKYPEKFLIIGIILLAVSVLLLTSSLTLGKKFKEPEPLYIRCKVCGRGVKKDHIICPYCLAPLREMGEESLQIGHGS